MVFANTLESFEKTFEGLVITYWVLCFNGLLKSLKRSPRRPFSWRPNRSTCLYNLLKISYKSRKNKAWKFTLFYCFTYSLLKNSYYVLKRVSENASQKTERVERRKTFMLLCGHLVHNLRKKSRKPSKYLHLFSREKIVVLCISLLWNSSISYTFYFFVFSFLKPIVSYSMVMVYGELGSFG